MYATGETVNWSIEIHHNIKIIIFFRFSATDKKISIILLTKSYQYSVGTLNFEKLLSKYTLPANNNADLKISFAVIINPLLLYQKNPITRSLVII